MKSGVQLIADERQRQVEVEGFTAEGDRLHLGSELAHAGACYALCDETESARPLPYLWPFKRDWWKPGPTRIRNLVKAGALIAAEIDRLLRLEASER